MSASLNCRVWPGYGLSGEGRLHVLDALIKGALRKADAEGGDGRTRHVERLHGDLHSLAFLAKKVGGGNVNVLQKQFDGVGAADSELVIDRPDGEARESALDDEGADSLHARSGIGERKDDVDAGEAAVGDPALGAVQDVLIAILDCGRLAGSRIGAGAGLGQAEGADFSVQHRLEVAALLLVSAGDEHGVHAQDAGGKRGAHAGATVAPLFQNKRLGQRVVVQPAIFLGNGHGEDVARLGGFQQYGWKLAGSCRYLCGERNDVLGDELFCRLLNCLLFRT